MKLDRNISGDGRGKYGLILNRKLAKAKSAHSPQGLMEIEHAVNVLETAGILKWGEPNTADEFFVMMLKDRYARSALFTYSQTARSDGQPEYADEVMALSRRAGTHNPFCKRPD